MKIYIVYEAIDLERQSKVIDVKKILTDAQEVIANLIKKYIEAYGHKKEEWKKRIVPNPDFNKHIIEKWKNNHVDMAITIEEWEI